jgi:hypothetical protein
MVIARAPSSGRVRDLETAIRDYVTDARFNYALYYGDRKTFHVVCSALDVIGDTTMAINAYVAMDDSGDYGVRYLQLYGLLQALIIQQDAVNHIIETLNLNLAADPDLANIRNIRNMATGHPNKREKNRNPQKLQSSHAISRPSLRKESFTLFSFFEDGKTPMDPIMVLELIKAQERAIVARLHAAIVELRRREVEHRMKFRDRKLAAFFPSTIGYYFEKCYEGCREDDDNGRRTFAQLHIELLQEILNKLRAELTERGIIPAYRGAVIDLEDAEYPLSELAKFMMAGADSTLNAKSANIFVFYLQHQFDKLQQMARAFDDEYQKDPPPVDNLPQMPENPTEPQD